MIFFAIIMSGRERKDSFSRIKDSPGTLRVNLRNSPRNSPIASPVGSPLATTLSPFSDAEFNSTPSMAKPPAKAPSSTGSDTKKVKKNNKKNCPCGMSSEGTEWLFVCCDCKQSWHGSCCNFKGSNNRLFQQPHITALSKPWQCPWCYTCAFAAPSTHQSVKNSKVLRESAAEGVAIQLITDAVSESIQKTIPSVDLCAKQEGITKLNSYVDALKSSSSSKDPEPNSVNKILT